jgi:diketogulonate reductase-like aldo/keto reductase
MLYGTLVNGVQVPLVGLGTYKISNEEMPSVLQKAFDCGYRKIDTARYYKNEEVIGRAISEIGIPRNELFITTKMDVEYLYKSISFFGRRKKLPIRRQSLRSALFQQLERLRTDYVDMYMLHAAIPRYYKYWGESVKKLYKEGYVKSIGVCSFSIRDFELYDAELHDLPMINQIEVSPYNTNKEIISYCKGKNVQVEAFATFGTTKKNPVAAADLLENEIINNISKRHGKTPSQVILRWVLEQGISVIPKAKSEKHLFENINVFDFELSADEMRLIDTLNENVKRRYFR